MILKTNVTASENQSKTIVELPLVIPESLIAEIEAFKARNSVAKSYSIHEKKPIDICCPQCLKAFVLQKAQEFNLNKKTIRYIENSIDCETGHSSYYLDSEELIKI